MANNQDKQQTIEETALEAAASVMRHGQSVTVDGMNVNQAALRDAYYILQQERKLKEARGRSLFRTINVSGIL